MKQIAKQELTRFLLSQNKPVFVPLQDAWVRLTEGLKPDTTGNPVKSPKEFFFAPSQTMMSFQKDFSLCVTPPSSEEIILFGVRSCDEQALERLDRVFLSDPADPYYQARREHTLIITLACSTPRSTCFCHTFGIDSADPAGDVTAWEGEDLIFLRGNTSRGQELLSALPEGEEEQVKKLQYEIREKQKQLPVQRVPSLSMQQFDSPDWEQAAAGCLSCGACTYLCPTCQCYDIREFNDGQEIKRFRCWDSCMYSDFTKMAHGNPRTTKSARFRQRFMHKLVYFPENNQGISGCVGCGRCITVCPAGRHIAAVAQEVKQ